jgi:hypothetical protein
MAEVLQYDEAMGSREAHQAVMKTRLDAAQQDYDRAVAKGVSTEAVRAAKELLDAEQQKFDQFMSGGSSTDPEENKQETIH